MEKFIILVFYYANFTGISSISLIELSKKITKKYRVLTNYRFALLGLFILDKGAIIQ